MQVLLYFQIDISNFLPKKIFKINTKTINSIINVSIKENFSSDDNDWSEDEAEIPAGVTDTVLLC